MRLCCDFRANVTISCCCILPIFVYLCLFWYTLHFIKFVKLTLQGKIITLPKKGRGWNLTCRVLLLWDAMLEAASCGSYGCTLVILAVTLVRASRVLLIFVICHVGESSCCMACVQVVVPWALSDESCCWRVVELLLCD